MDRMIGKINEVLTIRPIISNPTKSKVKHF